MVFTCIDLPRTSAEVRGVHRVQRLITRKGAKRRMFDDIKVILK